MYFDVFLVSKYFSLCDQITKYKVPIIQNPDHFVYECVCEYVSPLLCAVFLTTF